MVLENRRRFYVTKCSCGGVFQHDNHKKHRLNAKDTDEHKKVEGVSYCCICNVWKKEGEAFLHDSCRYIRLVREDMLRVLEGRPPKDRLALIKRREAEEEEKKKKVEEKKKRLLEQVLEEEKEEESAMDEKEEEKEEEEEDVPLVSPREVEFSQNKLIRPVERDREERKENEGEERTRNDK